MRKPVIMDCDPGHDDAIALILAHASDELEIKAVTTVAGNQTVEKTTLNALKVLSFIGAEVPVAKGCSKPLFRELITAASVHGETGFDGPSLPPPTLELLPMSAIELIAKTVRESDDKITLIPTGALTNIALFFITYPELKDKIERISLMGGSCFGGNWTPSAEFNILVDPEAADFVKFHDNTFDFGGSPLHDSCAVAWLIKPSLFEPRMCYSYTSGKAGGLKL